MTFDQLQQKWQSQKSELKIDPNLLLKEVRRNKRYIDSAVFWRDAREIGAAFLMFLFFLYFALKLKLWAVYPPALTVLWIGVFILTDRIIQKRKQPKLSDSLLDCIESSLAQINHQIWLLKNLFWWYLLPPNFGIFIFVGYFVWLFQSRGTLIILLAFAYSILVALTAWGIYHLNQRAVRKELLPRRQELEQLLSSLKNGDR